MSTLRDYDHGASQGRRDGQAIEVTAHLSHSDPEAWAAQTGEFQRGYNTMWAEVRRATRPAPLAAGTIVQYRKVGTFRVIAPSEPSHMNQRGDGWYQLEPVRTPKKYREDGIRSYWVGPANVIEAG